ncbi:MAG: phage tail assembly chaperone [Pseudomonadota bacterium]
MSRETVWGRRLAIGLGLLRLPPEAFWSLAYTEWRVLDALFEGRGEPLDRAGLETLRARFEGALP